MNSTEGERGRETPKWGLAGAVAAAIGASACCLGPLLLPALGVGGAWIGNLKAMERYRPYRMAATLVFLGLLALPYLISCAYAGGPEAAVVTRQVTLSVRNMT